MNHITLVISLNPISGDVTNWIFKSVHDRTSVKLAISFMENKYQRPVEVYHFQNCFPSGLMESWDICTIEQKTNWINNNLKNMAYSTQEGFTEYGNSVIKEIVYDEE